jgi:hypothetical protein
MRSLKLELRNLQPNKKTKKEGRKVLPSGLQPRLGDLGVLGIDFNADVAPA